MSQAQRTREKKLAEYAALSDQLEAALAGLSEAELDTAAGEGKWTIRQIVHHISDAQDLIGTVMKVALGNSGSTYDQTWYDMSNTWAETLDYAGRSIAPAGTLLRARLVQIEQLLRHLPDAWERCVNLKTAMTPEGREVTVEYLIDSQTHHALHHIAQIRAICEDRRS